MTGSFRVRLFGPGLPGGGTLARAAWRSGDLSVDGPQGLLHIPAQDLQMDAAGFNARQLRLSWQAREGSYALFIEQADDLERFMRQAPPVLCARFPSIRKQQRRLTSRFGAGLFIYGLILGLPLIVLVAFFMHTDALAGWVAEKIPPEYEAKIGDMVVAQVKSQGTLVESGPAYDAVKLIGERLTPSSRYQYRWFVAQDKQVNAFAAPGGVVMVYSGLIEKADRPEELAGVLAHEVAHVEQRHSLKALLKSMGFGVMLSLAIGDLSGPVAAWASNLTDLKFSRDAELEADREGLRRMVQAGIAPHGMADFFGKLAEKEGKPNSMLAILSTHPPSAERMEALRNQISVLPARQYQPLQLDWARVKGAVAAE